MTRAELSLRRADQLVDQLVTRHPNWAVLVTRHEDSSVVYLNFCLEGLRVKYGMDLEGLLREPVERVADFVEQVFRMAILEGK